MSDTSRRGFLAIAGVGAAGVAAASVVGVASADAIESKSSTLPHGASGAIVAYVDDVHDGQISVMVGERAVVLHDRDLVARLARAAAE